jgi:YHS domain-containing protein
MKVLLASILISLLTLQLSAQDATVIRKKHFNTESGLAIEGYDPVAYFKLNRAVKGKKDFAVIDQGVTYYFSSADYKSEFLKAPSAYEPRYGGWCAYAMGAKGEKVNVDPETFKILNSQLYLFYNSSFNNTLKLWNKDEVNLKTKADDSWTKIFR